MRKPYQNVRKVAVRCIQQLKELNKNILYISDLDGTLLRSNQMTSAYTNQVINRMTERGILFSYATARSIHTARIVTEGLNAKIPLILYNGVFIMDNQSGEIINANYFDDGVYSLLEDLFSQNVYPTVYSMLDGKERFSNIPEKSSEGTLEFIASRNDSRKRMVSTENELADEAYAVENAAPELKAAATAVIGGNNQDGVAKWLEQNCLE